MELKAMIPRASFSSCRNLYIALTLPAVGFVAARLIVNLASAASYAGIPNETSIYRAPSQRLLTAAEEENVPYPPDALPGGRNVDTPYGNTRVYEWGPENGRKVLFVHGISTPCIALARIARQLVSKGCRVMLFDLYGRGYSDAPDPSVYRQDIKLLSSQMLSVVSSSRLNWTDGFTLAGYSLGGGIAAAFTSYYPELVQSLVLIAPGGLLRPTRISLSSKLLYSGLLPDQLVNRIVKHKLQAGGNKPNVPKMKSVKHKLDVADAAAEELPDDNGAHGPSSESPLFEGRGKVSPATVVAWQTEVHDGFVPAFVSCVKWAPIHDGHEHWRTIGERCQARRSPSDEEDVLRGLKEGKVLLILGTSDAVISAKETEEDATTALGANNLRTVKLFGGHDLPITNSEGCARVMVDFWSGAA
ncbi:hypothetical protein DOTSEDRAFT_68141 [Dothistroma septosporum NZE10]|uniref:Serine aminopeptidase S33 domain-containing protein n=1 Tax=Dothistroma septosporum (strain NZE10 / CBS 128990) TaxID=675120 RepID=N1Q0G9_DOTSN|nr:hypothetical protein DOTSEDRAFT_68141 [Dothistroma septosporum NZE10]